MYKKLPESKFVSTSHHERRVACPAEHDDTILTDSTFAAQSDINWIVKRFGQTGELPYNGREPMYLDLTQFPENLADKYAFIERVEEAFYSLPAEIRTELKNDPANLEAYVHSEAGNAKLQELGVIPKISEASNQVSEPAPSSESKPAKNTDPKPPINPAGGFGGSAL